MLAKSPTNANARCDAPQCSLAGSLAPLLWKLPAFQALVLSQALSPVSPFSAAEKKAQLYAVDCLAKLDQDFAAKAYPGVIRLIHETPGTCILLLSESLVQFSYLSVPT